MEVDYRQRSEDSLQPYVRTDERILRQYDAYRVPSSALNEEAQAMAARMGIQKPVEVYVSRSKAINASMNVNHNKELRIVVTEPLLEAFDSNTHSLSEELKFVLGHELGHVAEGQFKPYLYGGLLPILTFPFIAIAARHYLDRAHAKQLSREDAKHYIYNQADQESNPLSAYQMNVHPIRFENVAVATSKDLAVGALGFGGGSFVAKVNADKLELRCDKWGAKMTSPEAGVGFFAKIETALSERLRLGIKVPENDPFRYGEAKDDITKALIKFMKKTVASHPQDSVRIGKLEKMVERVAQTAEQSASRAL